MRPYADLFFLGSAFLLLETKAVVGFALLFGTTWVVNAIVFAGVLLAVLASVEFTRRFRTPPLRVMYVLLAGALLLAYAVPASFIFGKNCCRGSSCRRFWLSCPSPAPMSSSPSASPRRRMPRRRSAPTCSEPCSAVASSTWRSSSAIPPCLASPHSSTPRPFSCCRRRGT